MVTRMGLRFPVIADSEMKLIQSFGVQQEGCDCALPALYIIDAQNFVRVVEVGTNIVDRVSSADIVKALTEAGQNSAGRKTQAKAPAK